jgi:predicted transcriptional regulator
MSMPISIRLDDDIRVTLEAEAKARSVGLSAYLRELATSEAKRVRRERIRQQSQAVGEYLTSSPEAKAFYEDWGTPQSKLP